MITLRAKHIEVSLNVAEANDDPYDYVDIEFHDEPYYAEETELHISCRFKPGKGLEWVRKTFPECIGKGIIEVVEHVEYDLNDDRFSISEFVM